LLKIKFMKLILLFLGIFWTQLGSAQIKQHSSVEYQLEYGINHVNFLNQITNLSPWGIMHLNKQFWKYNYSMGFKTIINKKHVIKLNKTEFLTMLDYNPQNRHIGLISLVYMSLDLGYAYILPMNAINNLVINLGTNFSYRYKGNEMVYYAYWPNQNWDEPLVANLDYNSIGISPNAEIEYFFTKHFCFGINLNFNYYPFENNKLQDGGFNQPDPFYVQTYKPQNLNFTSTFKLAYKFSLQRLRQ